MEIHGVPEPAAAPENGERRNSSFFRRVLARIRRRRIPPSTFPFKRTLLPLAIALLGFLVYQFCERSLRPVPPGHAGVAVNRFTGSLEVLAPGTHFRPRALYEIDVVISNCVINLAPDKPAVFREMVRVLKPGGRVLLLEDVGEDVAQEGGGERHHTRAGRRRRRGRGGSRRRPCPCAGRRRGSCRPS